MQVELKIKEILSGTSRVENKVKSIRKFMNWDEKELTNAILKYGTSGKEGRDSIIEEFWGSHSGKKNRGRR